MERLLDIHDVDDVDMSGRLLLCNPVYILMMQVWLVSFQSFMHILVSTSMCILCDFFSSVSVSTLYSIDLLPN